VIFADELLRCALVLLCQRLSTSLFPDMQFSWGKWPFSSYLLVVASYVVFLLGYAKVITYF
jgi:hypothetical protein